MFGALILWLAFVAAAATGMAPRARLPGVVLCACALACAGVAVFAGAGSRSLDILVQHPAFVGNSVETKDFLIETTQAPGFAWATASAVACAVLCGLAWAGIPRHAPVIWAILFGWIGITLALTLEKMAAPAAAVAFRLHGTCWLAAITAAVSLARSRPRLLPYAAVLLLIVTVIWLPSVVFGTLATRMTWGTSLDVHSIEFCAHRLAGTPLTLEPGSTTQLWYLLWAPLLMVFPILTWMSAGGVGFLVWMVQREADARAVAPAAS